jgi:hypothetical protein
VAQASSQWQQLINVIEELFDPKWSEEVLRQLSRFRSRKHTVPLVALGMAIALLVWNWKLLLATGTGILVMLAMYLMQQWDWPHIFHQWRRFLNDTNRSVAIAVATGGMTSLFTYMAVSIWIASENHWMATGAIVQGIGIIATFILLVWHILTHQSNEKEISLNELIVNLTDADPLKRLISVRQLTSLIRNHHCEREQIGAIADYFNLMWSRETEPLVRDALLDGLETLGESKQLGQGTSPLSIPFTAKHYHPVEEPIYDSREF